MLAKYRITVESDSPKEVVMATSGLQFAQALNSVIDYLNDLELKEQGEAGEAFLNTREIKGLISDAVYKYVKLDL